MTTVKDQAGVGRFSDLIGRYRGTSLQAAQLFQKVGLNATALKVLQELEAKNPSDEYVRDRMSGALRAAGRGEEAEDYLIRLLRERGDIAAKTPKSIKKLLRAMAGLEQLGKASSLSAARRINQLMSSDAGREMLGSAAAIVLAEHPDSILLIYARAVSLAKSGQFDAAHELVNAAMARRRAVPDGMSDREHAANARAFVQLGRIWRVVDGIARDNMAWSVADAEADLSSDANENEQSDAASDATDSVGEAKTDEGPTKGAAEEHAPEGGSSENRAASKRQELVFMEPLIQSRQLDRYLAQCEQSLEVAATLPSKIAAVKAMMRQGLRRLASYHEAYRVAGEHFERLRPMWTPLLLGPTTDPETILGEDGGLSAARQLRTVQQVARMLRADDDVEAIEDALIRLAALPQAETTRWMVAHLLVNSDPEKHEKTANELVKSASRDPKVNHEIESFFAWAAQARAHDEARRLFDALPGKARRTKALMHYVKILQRQGRFKDALKLVETIAATVVANPSTMCPFTAWNYVRRAGELAFCVKTADWYSKVPQPSEPKGVVFVMPRDINQLRRYPLVVLMELKRLGWAVIPLVQGALPVERTNNPEIDVFHGCMQADLRLSARARAAFEPIEGFHADVVKGELSWNDIELKHPLWEEAAINRRRFSVDFTCPALVPFLERLVSWTRLNAEVLHNARRLMAERGIPAAVMVLSQCRLPDAVNRLYCERKGDAQKFFCVHAANGYQNYFANFSTPISTKQVVRNMTATPELRTASFPPPAEFEAWYQAHRAEGPRMLDEVRDITKMRRSSKEAQPMPPEAQAVLDRARAWRARGGKVACAFGKVVCDLLVPHDGGPAHRNMQDWLNDTIEAVKGSDTLLLIKPHPHELRNEIGTFLTEYLRDLIPAVLPDNVVFVDHGWFQIYDLHDVIDLGLVYNGTTAIEFGLLGIPCALCSDYAPIDYPIGHVVPRDRMHYRRLVRFEEAAVPDAELKERAAAWLHYLSGDELTVPYRYHSRQVTNRVVYPPWWFDKDIERYWKKGDPNVVRLAKRITQPPKPPAAKTPAPPPRPFRVPAAARRAGAFRQSRRRAFH